jgi:hypothetical protein
MLSSHGDSVFCLGSNFVENQIGALRRRFGSHKAPIILKTTCSCIQTGMVNQPPARASSRMLASNAASKAASPVRPVA